MDAKLRAGRFWIPAVITKEDNRLFIAFRYNKSLIKEIKCMKNRKWHGFDEQNPRKIWSIENNSHNQFQLAYLMGRDPYAKWDQELLPYSSERPLRQHQIEMIRLVITVHQCILACDPGTGKSLAAIEAGEWAQKNLGVNEFWYVGPRAGVIAVQRELVKWKSKIKFKMYTYQGLVNMMKTYSGQAPRFLVIDESSKVKNPSAQRSEAVFHIAEAMRKEHDDFILFGMSGTPAPKAPSDWWNQCEIVRPGFLKEGHPSQFKQNLCIIEEREGLGGGVYPHIVTWLDDEKKCSICGKIEPEHILEEHDFKKSINEVARLYKRMKGLVLVKFKKDCLDLPDIQYQVIELTPTVDMLRTAKTIVQKSSRTIEALMKLRELADGFQYQHVPKGTKVCPNCSGSKTVEIPVPKEGIDVNAPDYSYQESDYEMKELPCSNCGGEGLVTIYEREAKYVLTVKDQLFIDLLDEHEDIGRFIVWGGFTATIDRLVELAHKYGWGTLRIDGRTYSALTATKEQRSVNDFLDAMDRSNPRYEELINKYSKICVVGHPQAAGMALTFTASPTMFFYSNTFDGEARMQAEHRFHRLGMDTNRGATVIDALLLPTDEKVLDNLKKKKNLQNMSMGLLRESIQ